MTDNEWREGTNITLSVDPQRHAKGTGIFRDHRCWKCEDGERPCAQGHPHRCDYPRARND